MKERDTFYKRFGQSSAQTIRKQSGGVVRAPDLKYSQFQVQFCLLGGVVLRELLGHTCR